MGLNRHRYRWICKVSDDLRSASSKHPKGQTLPSAGTMNCYDIRVHPELSRLGGSHDPLISPDLINGFYYCRSRFN